MPSCGCRKIDRLPDFVRKPKLVIEILSDNVMRDRVEKFLVYQRIPSLEEYAVVSQHPERVEVTVYRRADGWEPGETHRSGEFMLRSIGLTLRVEDLCLALPPQRSAASPVIGTKRTGRISCWCSLPWVLRSSTSC